MRSGNYTSADGIALNPKRNWICNPLLAFGIYHLHMVVSLIRSLLLPAFDSCRACEARLYAPVFKTHQTARRNCNAERLDQQ